MTLCTIDHKEKVLDGKKYEKDVYSLGEHYEVERYITRYEDGTVLTRFDVGPKPGNEFTEYLPTIYFSDDFFGTYRPQFTIQTTSYGSMTPDEVRKVIAGYQEAVAAVEVLTSNFC